MFPGEASVVMNWHFEGEKIVEKSPIVSKSDLYRKVYIF